MVAGAVISGAYFGDKLSPMSRHNKPYTTMVGADLFSHSIHDTYYNSTYYYVGSLSYLVYQ
jgi:Na+/H+ antiporter NhaC